MNHPHRLPQALLRLKRATSGRAMPQPPLAPVAGPQPLAPTTSFETLLLTRLTQIEGDLAELQEQNKWLGRYIGGAVLTAVLDLVIK